MNRHAEVINTPATFLRGIIDFIADFTPEAKDYVEPLNKYLLQPKYDGKNLQDTIKGLLGEKLALSETLTSVIIPAFDIKHFGPAIFSTLKVIVLLDFLIFSNIYTCIFQHLLMLPDVVMYRSHLDFISIKYQRFINQLL